MTKQYTLSTRLEPGMLTLSSLCIVIIILEIYFFRELVSGFLLFSIITVTTCLGGFITHKLTLVKSLWTLTDKGFKVTWFPQFKFQKTNDIFVQWTSVKSYYDNSGKAYSVFVIKLVGGGKMRFPYGALFLKDDSVKLQEAFHILYLNAVHPEQIPLGYQLKKDLGLT